MGRAGLDLLAVPEQPGVGQVGDGAAVQYRRGLHRSAAGAGEALGLRDAEVRALWRAGSVLGFGRPGVSNAIRDKPGRLRASEWERVHVENIYAKIGASNRAAASLYAVQHGLRPEDGDEP